MKFDIESNNLCTTLYKRLQSDVGKLYTSASMCSDVRNSLEEARKDFEKHHKLVTGLWQIPCKMMWHIANDVDVLLGTIRSLKNDKLTTVTACRKQYLRVLSRFHDVPKGYLSSLHDLQHQLNEIVYDFNDYVAQANENRVIDTAMSPERFTLDILDTIYIVFFVVMMLQGMSSVFLYVPVCVFVFHAISVCVGQFSLRNIKSFADENYNGLATGLSNTLFDRGLFVTVFMASISRMLCKIMPVLRTVGMPTVQWLWWCLITPFTMINVCLHSLFEELVFRRWLVMDDKRSISSRDAFSEYTLLILFSGLLFGMAHIINPEILQFFPDVIEMFSVFLRYTCYGFVLALCTVCGGGIEVSWALHFSHNFFYLCINGYSPSVIPMYSLYNNLPASSDGSFSRMPWLPAMVLPVIFSINEALLWFIPCYLFRIIIRPWFAINKLKPVKYRLPEMGKKSQVNTNTSGLLYNRLASALGINVLKQLAIG